MNRCHYICLDGKLVLIIKQFFSKNGLICQSVNGWDSNWVMRSSRVFLGFLFSCVYFLDHLFQLYMMGAGSRSSERCLSFISTSSSGITAIS